MLFLLLIPKSFAVDCARTFDERAIAAAAAVAERFYANKDKEHFASAREAMEVMLGCSSEVLSPGVVTEVHLVEALGANLDRKDRVPQAMAGVFATNPEYALPPALVPVNSTMASQIPAAKQLVVGDKGVALPQLGAGWFDVDGARTARAPLRRSALIQQVDTAGEVVATHYSWPDEPSFSWVVATVKAPAVTDRAISSPAPVEVSPWGHRAPLLFTTALAFAGSGLAYGLAAQHHATFTEVAALDGTESAEERAELEAHLKSIQARANPETIAAIAAGGVGVILGVVTVVTW